MMECGLFFMLDILYNATLQCQNVWPNLYDTCSCDLKTRTTKAEFKFKNSYVKT